MEHKKIHLIEWEVKDYPWEALHNEFTEIILHASAMEEAKQVIAKAMGK